MIEDINSERGEQFNLDGAITKGGAAYPLTWAGATVEFVAKRSLTDSAPLVSKTSAAAGGVDLGAPGVYVVHIDEADTAGFTRTELLSYEVRLTEGNGSVTVVAKGTWRVRLAAGA